MHIRVMSFVIIMHIDSSISIESPMPRYVINMFQFVVLFAFVYG